MVLRADPCPLFYLHLLGVWGVGNLLAPVLVAWLRSSPFRGYRCFFPGCLHLTAWAALVSIAKCLPWYLDLIGAQRLEGCVAGKANQRASPSLCTLVRLSIRGVDVQESTRPPSGPTEVSRLPLSLHL